MKRPLSKIGIIAAFFATALIVLSAKAPKKEWMEFRELSADMKTPNGVVVLNFGAFWNEDSFNIHKDLQKVKNCVPMIVLDQAVFAHYKIKVLPTIIFLYDGEEMQRIEGDVKFRLKISKEELQEIVNSLLDPE